MELEVVWSGATWRDVPAPVVATMPTTRGASERTARATREKVQRSERFMAAQAVAQERKRAAAKARILSALDGEWRTLADLCQRSGFSVGGIYKYLRPMERTGAVDVSKDREGMGQGAPRKLYRRKAQEQAA